MKTKNEGSEKRFVTLTILRIPKELASDFQEARKLKGYPASVFRRRALAFYVNHIRKEAGKEEKHYPLED